MSSDTRYVYDVNTNTNYNSDAEVRAGVSAMGFLADHLGAELAALAGRGLKAVS